MFHWIQWQNICHYSKSTRNFNESSVPFRKNSIAAFKTQKLFATGHFFKCLYQFLQKQNISPIKLFNLMKSYLSFWILRLKNSIRVKFNFECSIQWTAMSFKLLCFLVIAISFLIGRSCGNLKVAVTFHSLFLWMYRLFCMPFEFPIFKLRNSSNQLII